MDKLLRPKVFETDSNDPNAEKLYRHWKMTFANYIETSIPAIPEGAENAVNQLANIERKKLFALFNNISADIFDIVSEAANYDNAIQLLDAAYIKPASVVYNRHKLITCKQGPSQTIDTFKQELQRLSKNCNFQQITAEEYRQQYVRDAFINGISSAHIRQRLLENIGELSLDDAFAQARALEQAQSQSAAYENSTIAALPIGEEASLGAINRNKNSFSDNSDTTKQNQLKSKELCYFCGNSRHARSNCPARESECRNCKKKGHWAKVCRSTSPNTLGAAGFNDSYLT
ncbi:uncharacterized protein [Clytia hemisphaerica]|uniref:uncharacterized protein n=1 Tax=Clytia hemisphaerica TaxID=252671 RepID=UPI0034D4CCBB